MKSNAYMFAESLAKIESIIEEGELKFFDGSRLVITTLGDETQLTIKGAYIETKLEDLN